MRAENLRKDAERKGLCFDDRDACERRPAFSRRGETWGDIVGEKAANANRWERLLSAVGVNWRVRILIMASVHWVCWK